MGLPRESVVEVPPRFPPGKDETERRSRLAKGSIGLWTLFFGSLSPLVRLVDVLDPASVFCQLTPPLLWNKVTCQVVPLRLSSLPPRSQFAIGHRSQDIDAKIPPTIG